MKKVRSILVDIELWKKFQIYAITLNKSVSSLIEEHMRQVISKLEKEK